MWFRNLQLYRLPTDWDMTADRLSEQLGRLMFQACGSQDLATQGWASPVEDQLVFSVDGQWLIALGVEQRLLPSSVVKQVAEDKAEELEAQQGFKPGRKQMKEIKEAVMQELLPRAFTRRRKVYAWIDPKAGYLAVDASSRNAAEPLIETLHKALDELPLKLVNTERSPVPRPPRASPSSRRARHRAPSRSIRTASCARSPTRRVPCAMCATASKATRSGTTSRAASRSPSLR